MGTNGLRWKTLIIMIDISRELDQQYQIYIFIYILLLIEKRFFYFISHDSYELYRSKRWLLGNNNE